MTVSSKKENAENEKGGPACNRPLVHIMDDSHWSFVRKSFRMSPREMDVAKMICSGFSNEEISSRLEIKITTVKTHLRNVYRRIRVQRKLDMLLMFLDQSAKYTNSISPTKPILKIQTETSISKDISDTDTVISHQG